MYNQNMKALEEKKKLLKPNLPTDNIIPSDLLVNDSKPTNTVESNAKITGGNYAETTSSAPLSKKTLDGEIDSDAPKSKINTGSAIAGGLEFGGALMARNNSEPLNSKQSSAATFGLAAQGASAGMAIGGPWGAAAGAVVGAGFGLIKGKQDAKKLDKKAKQERLDYLSKSKIDRENAQVMNDGESRINKSKALAESQLGMISSKYI